MEKINFKDRISKFPNRKKLKIVSSNEGEIVADVINADEPQVEGTEINAKILNRWQEVISASEGNATLAKTKVAVAEENSKKAIEASKQAELTAERALFVADMVNKGVNNMFIPIKTSEIFNDNNYISAGKEQDFSEEEKQIARENIGAGTSNFSGEYADLKNAPIIPVGSRLYETTGPNTDGAITQKGITEQVDSLNTKIDKIEVDVSQLQTEMSHSAEWSLDREISPLTSSVVNKIQLAYDFDFNLYDYKLVAIFQTCNSDGSNFWSQSCVQMSFKGETKSKLNFLNAWSRFSINANMSSNGGTESGSVTPSCWASCVGTGHDYVLNGLEDNDGDSPIVVEIELKPAVFYGERKSICYSARTYSHGISRTQDYIYTGKLWANSDTDTLESIKGLTFSGTYANLNFYSNGCFLKIYKHSGGWDNLM